MISLLQDPWGVLKLEQIQKTFKSTLEAPRGYTPKDGGQKAAELRVLSLSLQYQLSDQLLQRTQISIARSRKLLAQSPRV